MGDDDIQNLYCVVGGRVAEVAEVPVGLSGIHGCIFLMVEATVYHIFTSILMQTVENYQTIWNGNIMGLGFLARFRFEVVELLDR